MARPPSKNGGTFAPLVRLRLVAPDSEGATRGGVAVTLVTTSEPAPDFVTGVAELAGVQVVAWSRHEGAGNDLRGAAPTLLHGSPDHLTDDGGLLGFIQPNAPLAEHMYDGRTGEIVWLDREGVWHDAYDSRWYVVGPCVPTGRGFLAPIDDELARFEGFPATITQLASVGGSPVDTAIDLALERVVIDYGDRRAVLNATDDSVTVRIGREESREAFEHTAEPGPQRRWSFEPIDDPDLGRIWRPDRERATQLLTSLRALHAVDPKAAATALQEATRGPSIKPARDPDTLEATVWRSLQRWVTEPLTRASLQRVSERLDALDDDPFLEHALRSALSTPESAELLSRLPPPPAVIEMLDALVADELVELTHPADESLQSAIDAVVRDASSIEAAAEALEELLLEHDAVEELHADREELERRVAAAWAAGRG